MRIISTVKSVLVSWAMVVGFISNPAYATSYTFGVPLSDSSPIVNQTFATLDVANVGLNSYQFTLKALDLSNIFGSSSFLGALIINAEDPTPSLSDWYLVGTSGNVGNISVEEGAPQIGGFTFDFTADYPNSNANGQRLQTNEWVSWVASFSSELILESPKFGLHVQGIGLDGEDSGWYQPSVPPPAVPVPAAAWLFGSALLGFVAMSNRRKV